MYEKTLYIQSLGGYGVVIGNSVDSIDNINIGNIGIENTIRIPVVVVSKKSYQRIVTLKQSSYKIFNKNMQLRFMVGRCLPLDSEFV